MQFDLNGRPVRDPMLRRVVARLGRRSSVELTLGDPDLVPVAESSDDAAASSAVLDASPGFDAAAQSVLWHLVVLPSRHVDRVLELVGQDRYQRVEVSADELARFAWAERAGETGLVAFARVQTVDALHVAQERSRVAGVTARHDGAALLWRVLQAPR